MKILQEREGYIYTTKDLDFFTETVYLGCNDCEENYIQIPIENYIQILKDKGEPIPDYYKEKYNIIDG